MSGGSPWKMANGHALQQLEEQPLQPLQLQMLQRWIRPLKRDARFPLYLRTLWLSLCHNRGDRRPLEPEQNIKEQ